MDSRGRSSWSASGAVPARGWRVTLNPLEAREWYAIGVLVFWSFLFIRGLVGIRRTKVLSAYPSGDGETSCDAFIPCRDEKAVIEANVRGLAASHDVVRRIVVVDDGSTDGSKEILRTLAQELAQLSVVEGTGPGPGEFGKPAALAFAVAAQPSDAEWLLFLDADVVVANDFVARLMSAARSEGADLVSVLPRLSMLSLVEQVVLPAVGSLIVARHPPERVADPNDPLAFANGQVILVRRSFYEQVGGHRAVINEVLEDKRLAERLKQAGARLLIVDGSKFATTRMYDSWAELREGWTKNLFDLLGSNVATALSWCGLSLLVGLLPLSALIVAGWPFGVLAYGAVLLMQAYLRARMGARLWAAPLAPVGAVLTVWLVLESVLRRRFGKGIAWKGRRYGA